MKKNLKLSIVAIIAIMLSTSVSPSTNRTHSKETQKNLISFTWFKDEVMSDPTGTISDIDTEIERLRVLFPYYVFTSSHSMGLSAFEFGYYPNQSAAVIYSDR